MAENLCLRHQLVVLKRRQARPRIRDTDRRFWVLACRWCSRWRDNLIIVKPDTVIRWHRIGWKAHWRRRSRRPGKAGRNPTDHETRQLIRRMAQENPLNGTRQIVHARVTAHPNAHWLAQQMVEACGPETHARFLIHDGDRCFGAIFDRRVASLGIRQVRTPVQAPRANAIAERWARSIRSECLDHRLIFGRRHLQRTVLDYTDCYNRWWPHRSLGQQTPCRASWEPRQAPGKPLTGKPILGGLHSVYHVYHWAA